MDTSPSPFVQVAITGSVATVALDRPDVHNALDATLIRSLTTVFQELGARDDLRAVVLRGEGPSFCAGADVQWMRASLDWTRDENIADATAITTMFAAVDRCPLPVIARVHGAALGGGMGLVACCDIAIAAENATFGLTEVKLGIIPATISPYIVAKIGMSQSRRLFLTGERFKAEQAQALGLVHQIVPVGEIDAAIEATLAQMRKNGPQAMRAAKALLRQLPTLALAEVARVTSEAIADRRISPEAQEGLHAFLEKRRASWVEEQP